MVVGWSWSKTTNVETKAAHIVDIVTFTKETANKTDDARTTTKLNFRGPASTCSDDTKEPSNQRRIKTWTLQHNDASNHHGRFKTWTLQNMDASKPHGRFKTWTLQNMDASKHQWLQVPRTHQNIDTAYDWSQKLRTLHNIGRPTSLRKTSTRHAAQTRPLKP